MTNHKQFIEIGENIQLWVETSGNKNNEACLFISGAVQTVHSGRIGCVMVW